jgi:CTP synthase
VCLGFQIAVIQFARDNCNLTGANSEEFQEFAADKVIMNMPDLDQTKMGGTMRLGLKKTVFQKDTEWSKLRALYDGADVIEERHRHRYEVNPEYVDRLMEAGMAFIGKDESGKRMSVFELKDHPYYIGELAYGSDTINLTVTEALTRFPGTQFHAEYQSRVLDPSVSPHSPFRHF